VITHNVLYPNFKVNSMSKQSKCLKEKLEIMSTHTSDIYARAHTWRYRYNCERIREIFSRDWKTRSVELLSRETFTRSAGISTAITVDPIIPHFRGNLGNRVVRSRDFGTRRSRLQSSGKEKKANIVGINRTFRGCAVQNSSSPDFP